MYNNSTAASAMATTAVTTSAEMHYDSTASTAMTTTATNTTRRPIN